MVTTTTSYIRRHGAYRYDVQVLEDAGNGRYIAKLRNLVRMEAGEMIAVNLELHEAYGVTRAEAFANLDLAVKKLVEP